MASEWHLQLCLPALQPLLPLGIGILLSPSPAAGRGSKETKPIPQLVLSTLLLITAHPFHLHCLGQKGLCRGKTPQILWDKRGKREGAAAQRQRVSPSRVSLTSGHACPRQAAPAAWGGEVWCIQHLSFGLGERRGILGNKYAV